MNDHSPTRVSASRPKWTEDRVERLLLSLFAETPSVVVPPAGPVKSYGSRSALLVVAAAACLAVIVPVLSARVVESAGDESPLARWVGPAAVSPMSTMNLASSEDSEAMSDSSSETTTDESDETAEAPVSTETEESAST